MTEKYKIEIESTVPGESCEFYLNADGHIEVSETVKLKEPIQVLGDLTRICTWLKRNGGVKVEIIEESS